MNRPGGSRGGQPEAGSGTLAPGGSGRPDAGQPEAARRAGVGEPGATGGWRRAAGRHLVLLAAYVAAGIAVTWPLVSYPFRGLLPGSRDVSSYVWALWWVARQVSHLGNPWLTTHMAAPAGMQLGFDTLILLPALLITPVTLLFGPSASFGLLAILTPGLLCYVTYRAARLWLGRWGAIAAGALFGLSTMVTWQDWFHLNISLGTLFLPMTLEAAVRLRRAPGWPRGIACGLVLGAAVLTNQESAVVATLLAAAVLAPWLLAALVRERGTAARRKLLALLAAAVVAAVVASPQLIAMAQQAAAGGASAGGNALARTYLLYGQGIPAMFAGSPRLHQYHLGALAAGYAYREPLEGVVTFGVVLCAAAVLGLAVTWRRRSSWWLALLWLAGAALALGPTLQIASRQYVPLATRWHGVLISQLLPYSWLVRVPGMSALREADRLALLGLLGAAILAGAGVEWLTRRARQPAGRPALAARAVLALVIIAGLAEAGWSGTGSRPMPTATTRLDAPIAADHSGSVVLDLPFGLRGGIPLVGSRIALQPLVMATADGHPRAISYSSWVPRPTITRMLRHPFYDCLIAVQDGRSCGAARIAAAAADARALRIGWVVDWYSSSRVLSYLRETGFRPDYRVGRVAVWRPGRR